MATIACRACSGAKVDEKGKTCRECNGQGETTDWLTEKERRAIWRKKK